MWNSKFLNINAKRQQKIAMANDDLNTTGDHAEIPKVPVAMKTNGQTRALDVDECAHDQCISLDIDEITTICDKIVSEVCFN